MGHPDPEPVTIPAYYPYLSEEARETCFSYLDRRAATHWPVTADERMVPTSFGETFVRVSGPAAAPPLVLLHGAGATSLMWEPNIEALSKEHRTYAVDQMGEYGKSPCTRPLPVMDDLLAWLDQLFDGLELARGVSLIGVSYGGALAAQYALHSPGRLARVVLIAPGNTVLRTSARFWARLFWMAVNRRKGLPGFFRWVFSDMQRKDPRWVESTVEELSLNMRSIRRHRPPMPPVLTDAEWRGLKVPTLFLAGEHDVMYSSRKAVRRLNRVAPQVTTEIVPGAGHDLTFAHTEAVNRRILEFLGQARALRARMPG